MNDILGVGKVQWAYDRLVEVQIKETLHGLGDDIVENGILWRYFKTLQSMMQSREIIPKEIVEKYEDTIFFMVDTNQCLLEVVEKRNSWIMPMEYEVEGHVLDAYSQHLLRKLVDKFEEMFVNYNAKSLDLHSKFKKLEIQMKVRKEVEQLVENLGITKEEVWRDREKNILSEEDIINLKKAKLKALSPIKDLCTLLWCSKTCQFI